MTTLSCAFGRHLLEHFESQIDTLAQTLNLMQDERLSPAASLRQALVVIATGMAQDDARAVAQYAQEIGAQRARQRFNIEVMLNAYAHIRAYIWDYLLPYIQETTGWAPLDIRAIEDILHVYELSYFGSFSSVYQDMQNELLSQTTELERQRALIRELSSPIVPIAEGILLLPLVGAMDDARATRITESVLNRIVQTQAGIILLDITGVPLVDTHVAGHLMNLTRAVSLLGAQVVLVGISPDIAQTIIQLGIDLGAVITLADLQAGVAYALRRRHIG